MNRKIVKDLLKMAKELIALDANLGNLYKALNKVVDVDFTSNGIYSSTMDKATYNKVRKVLAKRLNWLGFEMVRKWPGGQLWRNDEMGGVEIEIYGSRMMNGWSFAIQRGRG